MNQHDQMQHDEERLEQLYWEFDQARKQSGEERWHFKGFMRGYANHVVDSNKMVEPAPLVRLTAQQLESENKLLLSMLKAVSSQLCSEIRSEYEGTSMLKDKMRLVEEASNLIKKLDKEQSNG